MATTHTIRTGRDTGPGRTKYERVNVQMPALGLDNQAAVVGVLREVVSVEQFTDGGGASGTYQMRGAVPKGAVLLGSKVLVPGAFAGDTSAVLIIGDGSDTDRYMTGTPSVFGAAADGIQTGVPSGNKLLTAANRPTLTVTSGSDFTDVVTDGNGELDVSIYYIEA